MATSPNLPLPTVRNNYLVAWSARRDLARISVMYTLNEYFIEYSINFSNE